MEKDAADNVFENVVPLIVYYKYRKRFAYFTGAIYLALLLIITGLSIFTYHSNYGSSATPVGSPQPLNLTLNFNSPDGTNGPTPASSSFRFLGRVNGFAFADALLLDGACLPKGAKLSLCQSAPVEELRKSLISTRGDLEAVLLFGSTDKKDLKSSSHYKSNEALAQARALSIRDCLLDLISHSRTAITIVSTPQYFANGQSCEDRSVTVYADWTERGIK